jgi:small subunit ribosomal protein S25e
MPPKAPASKAAKAAKASSSGKAKKKWSKGKTRESLNNAVMWEKGMIEKLKTEVPKYKVITPTVVSDRLKVTVSLAAEGLKYLAKQGTIRLVSNSGKYVVYSRNITKEEEKKEEKKEEKPEKKTEKK